MVKLPHEVKRMITEKEELAFISTVDAEGRPNLCAKGSLSVLDDENLWYIEVVGGKTCENLKKNPHVAVAIASQKSLDGYQIKGKATLLREGPLYEKAVKFTEELSSQLRKKLPKPLWAVKIKVEEIYSLKPDLKGEKLA